MILRDKGLKESYLPRCGRHGGLMVNTLDSGSKGPGLSPGRGHCAKHLASAVQLSTQEYF